MTCQWAGCAAVAFREDADGYLHCRPHWTEHLALIVEDTARPCVRCGEGFTSRTVQARTCQPCRQSRKHKPMQPCGTRAAFERHKGRGEVPCEPCREAERTYQRERAVRRRAA